MQDLVVCERYTATFSFKGHSVSTKSIREFEKLNIALRLLLGFCIVIYVVLPVLNSD
jgi:hypothetical protein